MTNDANKPAIRTKLEANPAPLPCPDIFPSSAIDVIAEAQDRASLGGCLEQAFYYGYQAALRLQFPSIGAGPIAMCHSERSGAGPAQIVTKAYEMEDMWYLEGHKSFVTAPEVVVNCIVTAEVELESTLDHKEVGLFVVTLPLEGAVTKSYPQVSIMPRLGQGQLFLDHCGVVQAARLKGSYSDVIRSFGVRESLTCTLAAISFLQTYYKAEVQALASQENRPSIDEAVVALIPLAQGDCDVVQATLQVASLRDHVGTWFASMAKSLPEGNPDRHCLRMFGFQGPLWDKRIAFAKAHQAP